MWRLYNKIFLFHWLPIKVNTFIYLVDVDCSFVVAFVILHEKCFLETIFEHLLGNRRLHKLEYLPQHGGEQDHFIHPLLPYVCNGVELAASPDLAPFITLTSTPIS